MKVPVVNRQEYIIYLEYFNEMYWLHTDVFKWSTKIKKEYLKELDTLLRLLNNTIYSLIEEENIKLSKFAEVIGFKDFKYLQSKENNLYRIYTRSPQWVS